MFGNDYFDLQTCRFIRFFSIFKTNNVQHIACTDSENDYLLRQTTVSDESEKQVHIRIGG